MTAKRIAIVGGGIAGLAAAFETLERIRQGAAPWAEAVVFEKAARLGGNIRTERDSGFICEWGPEGFLDNTPQTLSLAERVGLGGRLVRARPEANRRYIFRAGRLHLVPTNPPAFLRSGILPLGERLRVFLEPLIPARRDGADESVFDFAARRIGRGAAARLVDAMVSGVYAGDARRLSLPAAFPKMRAMESQYGGLVKAMIARARRARRTGEAVGGPSGPRGALTTFENGLETFIEGLGQAIGPDRIRLDCAVRRIERQAGRYGLELESGERDTADAVLVAAPSDQAAPMLRPLSAALADGLARIPFAGIAVACLGHRTADAGRELDGWTSSTFAGRAPGGTILTRAMIGGATFPEALEWSDEEIQACFDEEIAPILAIRGDPVWRRIFRFPAGIAQYNLGHLALLERIGDAMRPLPGLFLSGASYRGISINAACEAAPKAAQAILDFLGQGANGASPIF